MHEERKEKIDNFISKEDLFYICYTCDFVGWRPKAQGPCCTNPDQIYVVDWIYESGKEVMIRPK